MGYLPGKSRIINRSRRSDFQCSRAQAPFPAFFADLARNQQSLMALELQLNPMMQSPLRRASQSGSFLEANHQLFGLILNDWMHGNGYCFFDAAARYSAAELERQQLQMKVSMDCQWKNHDPHPIHGPDYSIYSDTSYRLKRSEWYEFNVDVSFGADCTVENIAEMKTVFHGTEWGSGFRIVFKNEGFIVGSSRCGGHAGLWAMPSFGEGACRANPDRYKMNGNYTRWCMPVVIELASCLLKKHRGTSKHFIPGCTTSTLRGKQLMS